MAIMPPILDLARVDGEVVEWMEKVSEEQYGGD
jgi:hypothetical protein